MAQMSVQLRMHSELGDGHFQTRLKLTQKFHRIFEKLLQSEFSLYLCSSALLIRTQCAYVLRIYSITSTT